MGFNTIAFILNDSCHELEKSPKTVAWMLAHPPNHGDVELNGDRPRTTHGDFWWCQVDNFADQVGEPRVNPQTFRLLPTSHADFYQWLAAGWNGIAPLKFIRFGSTKDGKITVTLELPEWFPTHPKNRKKYGR